MKDQHKKITGYPDLNQEEIDLINEGKDLAIKCGAFIHRLEYYDGTDKQNVKDGKRNLQQGFMWLTRSIAKPTTF